MHYSLGRTSFDWIPVNWDIKLFDGSDERSINELPVHESLVLVILRGLAIQRGISLAIENDYIGDTFIEEAKDYSMLDSTEKLFVRFGAEYFRNLYPSARSPATRASRGQRSIERAKPTTTSTMSNLVFLASGLASSTHLSS